MSTPSSTFKIGGVPGGVRQLLNVQTVAAAGSAITDATQITTKGPALVKATGADASKGIKLPKAVAGKNYRIKNADAAVLKVYPYDTSTIINALSAGAAISMAASVCAEFLCVDTTHWVTLPLLPS
jgi:hypothetical protein